MPIAHLIISCIFFPQLEENYLAHIILFMIFGTYISDILIKVHKLHKLQLCNLSSSAAIVSNFLQRLCQVHAAACFCISLYTPLPPPPHTHTHYLWHKVIV